MNETGKVTKIKPDGRAVVRFDRKASCESCNMCMSKRNMYIDYTLENTANAKAGDTVIVDLSTAALSIATLIVYVLPIAAALVAFMVTWGMDQRIQFGAALGAVGAAFALAAVLDAKYFKRKRLKPKMIKIINMEESQNV
ncbi:hypothetical protein FACS1894211_10930 [Clostridia bacterium]|nr:hypothetical protein FACS1894211_10930 [Clostridia bacterium]